MVYKLKNIFIGFIQEAASILGGMVFSAAMIKGVAFSLATTSFYGVLLLVIMISGYKEPVEIQKESNI